MMKNGLTTVQKRLILILGGLLILLGTVIFVFQRNMKQANRLKTDSSQKMNEVNYLSDLQIRVNEMNASQAKTQKEIQRKSQTYPCKMTQQKAISNIYKMSVASGVRLRAIRPQADKTFFKDGKFIVTTGTGDDAEQSTESEETTLSDVEKNPEKKVSVMKMVGKASPYEIELTGTKKQILKAIDWVAKNEEPMSVVSINLTFDNSTGKFFRNIYIGKLHRLQFFAAFIYMIKNLWFADSEFIAFTAHVLNKDRKMQFSTTGYLETVRRIGIFHAQADISVQLTHQTFS